MTSHAPAELPGLREEVDRILASRAFRECKTLQQLLEYLLQRTLDGTAESLKEYVIGVDIFHKPKGYDPQTDASVRVQIGRLRRKLEEYYQDEGASDSLRLQLPKRQFAIAFEHKPATPASRADLDVQPTRPRVAPGRLLHWGLTIFLASWVVFLVLKQPDRPERAAPDIPEIWKEFVAESRPILISLGTLQFYHYSRGMIREPALDHLTPAEREPRLLELQTLLHSTQPLEPDLIYTGVGQATAAFLLSKQFDRMNVPVDLVRSNALGWDDIAQHNMIFVGSAKLNAQIRDIPVTWAFRVEGDRILNLHPKSGEPESFGPDCSLVSMFPGLHGRGDILIVESGSGTGVWAAGQFLTDPEYTKELAAHIREPNGRLPRHYQVVLKSQIVSDVPIRISYVMHRAL